MKWFVRTLVCLALACLITTGRVEAHAALIEAVPADGVVVATAPASMRLRFNEPVSPLVIRLIDATGVTYGNLHHEARDQTITVRLPDRLPPGTQVLSYRVTSSDGHPIGGSLVFSIGAPSIAPVQRTAAAVSLVAATIWMTRLALYVGLFVGAGGALFTVSIGLGATTPASRTIIRTAIGVGFAASILSVGLQGLDALGERLPALLTPHPWHAGLKTSFGLTAVTAILTLVCAWISTIAGTRWTAFVGLGGAGLALALSGHASTASPQWLTRPTVFVHGIGVAFWIGALLPLALIVWNRRGESLPIVRLFSFVAIPVLGLIVLAGLILSVVQLRTPASLLTTGYGRVFLAKMAAVVCLMGLAAFNRQRLTPMFTRKDSAARHLVRSITGEIAFAIVILGLVTTWRFTPPPRALGAPEAAIIHLHTPEAMLDLTATPGRPGPVTIHLSLMTRKLEVLGSKEVTVSLANPGAGIEPMVRHAVKMADGTWQVEKVVLPVPGRWIVRVEVLVTDFEKFTLESSVELR